MKEGGSELPLQALFGHDHRSGYSRCSLDGAKLAKRNPGSSGRNDDHGPLGLDHRFDQHPPLHRYQPWQAGSPIDCYGPNDVHGLVRHIGATRAMFLVDGACPHCGLVIPGRWN